MRLLRYSGSTQERPSSRTPQMRTCARRSGSEVELAGAVEAADRLRHLLAEEPIGADDARQAEARAAARRVVDDEEMVADAGRSDRRRAVCAVCGSRRPRHLLVEDAVAERLRAPHLGGGGGEPHFQVAESPERWSAARGTAPARKPAREERRQCWRAGESIRAAFPVA